ncbi:MAG: hypothetical protein J5J06_02995 [Phycisphaerae bacterium]|nr:hypothetical protein [Phycisphaerae bacterium]
MKAVLNSVLRIGFFAVVLSMVPPVRAEIVEVNAEGKGITKDAACKDALRVALERGGQVEISSHSQTENFELIRDTIYARADGIVTDYKVVKEEAGAGGVFYCTIRAKVDKSVVSSEWGAVQNVLDQIGRPGIAVYILERIDGVVQDSSILETQIEKRLLDIGFTVYAGEQIRKIMEKESADAAAEDNVAKVQAIAKDFGTEIFVTGTAQANAAGVKDLFGEPTAMYNADAAVKMFYTDTGQLIASESIPNWRGGARGFHTTSPQAGKKALENAGVDLVENVYYTIMKQWATRISSGGEITLEVEGMSVAKGLRIKQRLRDLDPDKIVSVDGPKVTKGVATFRIKAKMTAEELAEYLVRDEWADTMEVVDLKSNRIQAKAVGD